jgi:hypothetical protein
LDDTPMKIAILGWGSLLWDRRKEFDDQHEDWQFDGPTLKLEFSRVSQTRSNALTLVLDARNGKSCRVAYAISKRESPDDAICDLRCREGATLKKIGIYFADGTREQSRDHDSLAKIRGWALPKKIDVVIWTDLESNFKGKSRNQKSFSIKSALSHIQALDPEGKAKAAEYVWRAPKFVDTPLRKALQSQPWFSPVSQIFDRMDDRTI